MEALHFTAQAPERPARPALAPTPVLKVRTEPILIEGGEDPLCPEYCQKELPVLELGFRYGRELFRAADDCTGLRIRSWAAEDRARRLLESFGAVELGCLSHYEPSYGSTADYVVQIDGDVHSYCSFSAYALPQLRALGWQIEVAEGYPYQVIGGSSPWYVQLDPLAGLDDWFSFELGITVDGRQLSLLPALLDLLRRSPDRGDLDELARSSRMLAVPAGPNLYVPVAASRLRRVLQVLSDLYHRRSRPADLPGRNQAGRWPFHRLQAGALADLDRALAGHPAHPRWLGEPADELCRLGEQLAAGLRPSASGPVAGLRGTLRPYQQSGVAWLQHLCALGLGGVIADDMGLGKTLQIIAHLLAEKQGGRLTEPALVVVPTSLVGSWSRELFRFAPALRVLVLHGAGWHERTRAIAHSDVVITTYPLLRKDRRLFAELRFAVLVLDEAQAIKNLKSQVSRAVRAVEARQRICLSGTPIENNLLELFAIFDFVTPGLLGHPLQFKQHFCQPIELGDEERLAALRRAVAPFLVRRRKSEVAAELPPKTEIVRPVDLPDDQRELYESIRVAAHAKVRKLIRDKGLAASTVPVLDALLKLRQVCCDPRLVRVPAARRVAGSAKYEVLLELVTQQLQQGRRILVFSQFTSMLALISEGLQKEGICHLSLTGATSDRQARVDAFQQGQADVFLISLKAGGTGLTLTRADTVVHYDPWWNPAAQAQATDRAHRIGQTQPVFVYNLIVAGSVEERMLQLQQRKRRLADAILTAQPASTALGVEDLDDLLAPLS